MRGSYHAKDRKIWPYTGVAFLIFVQELRQRIGSKVPSERDLRSRLSIGSESRHGELKEDYDGLHS